MGILNFFLGDNLNLRRPDFTKYNHLELNFSDNMIRFVNSKHTAMIPVNTFPSDLNIYDESIYPSGADGVLSKHFYTVGWEFKGRGESPGGITLKTYLIYYTDSYLGGTNCFELNTLHNELLKYCHAIWGDLDESPAIGQKGSGSYIYPMSSKDFQREEINGSTWSKFSGYFKSNPPVISYATTLSKNHIIINAFRFDEYESEFSFYGPETNLEETCYSVMNDFMSKYFIELSPRSLKEKSEAEAS